MLPLIGDGLGGERNPSGLTLDTIIQAEGGVVDGLDRSIGKEVVAIEIRPFAAQV